MHIYIYHTVITLYYRLIYFCVEHGQLITKRTSNRKDADMANLSCIVQLYNRYNYTHQYEVLFLRIHKASPSDNVSSL